MNIGCRRYNRMNQLAATVHTNVRLHAEVPLITLLRLVHLRITRLVLVLRRTRRIDDRGIDYRAKRKKVSEHIYCLY